MVTTVRPSPGTRRRRRSKMSGWRGLLYISPALALVIMFFILPVLLTVWMSLHNWPLLGTPKWIGFDNYIRLASDQRFLSAFGFTMYYTIIVTIAIFVVAFPLALFAEKQRKGIGTYRTFMFMPMVVGLATASLLWVWLSHPESGLFGPAVKMMGLADASPNFMATFNGAFTDLIIMVVWKIAGFTMIILLTGLQSISGELTEAARIDGAGPWRRFRLITLPLMRRTLALALILSITGSVLAFDQFYIMTSGGPDNRMISMVYYIFNQSFVSFRLGYGSALSIVLLLFLVALSVVQMKLLKVGDDRP